MRHPLYWFNAEVSTVEPFLPARFVKHINDFDKTVIRVIYIQTESRKQVVPVFPGFLYERDMAEVQM
jgi:hypothetical protein